MQSRYWSSDSSKNEVQGVVLDRAGEVVHRFGGLWHEGIFCDTFPTPQCIWKPSEYTHTRANTHTRAATLRWVGLAITRCDVTSCPAVQLDDHVKFYGFSQYARELNELTPDLEGLLPPTDSRYRPDQRYKHTHTHTHLCRSWF